MNIFSALWITEMCFHAKLKAKKKNQPQTPTRKLKSLHFRRLYESETNMCLCHHSAVWPKTRQNKALQSTWKQINSLGKSFAGHSWKAKKIISIFSPLQNNHLAAFQNVKLSGLSRRWNQWKHFPVSDFPLWQLKMGFLMQNSNEGEEREFSYKRKA